MKIFVTETLLIIVTVFFTFALPMMRFVTINASAMFSATFVYAMESATISYVNCLFVTVRKCAMGTIYFSAMHHAKRISVFLTITIHYGAAKISSEHELGHFCFDGSI